ncbi:Hypothetical protein AA314_02235 [Archangium gephyra]|uniref:Uncharacterized protein n=1 Tax=Archangium gephyra TaxID=48 RepID=A0AAC8Q4V0_9BACT|nr:Hypothetical protein AA314_02235 [Archangium gephyra]
MSEEQAVRRQLPGVQRAHRGRAALELEDVIRAPDVRLQHLTELGSQPGMTGDDQDLADLPTHVGGLSSDGVDRLLEGFMAGQWRLDRGRS